MQTFTFRGRKQPPWAGGAEGPSLVVISEQSGTRGCFLGLSTSPAAPGSPGAWKTEQASGTGSAAGGEQG